MAISSQKFVILIFVMFNIAFTTNAQMSQFFYGRTCPNMQFIVQNTMRRAISNEPRMGASILRLFFHDCFVNGCDGSILLDDTPSFTGEKNAFANINSARGFEVIDTIKSNLESVCPGIVSCADILAQAAKEAVFLLGGPGWTMPLGRRDARTASQSDANANLPAPSANLPTLISLFAAKNLNPRDMTALSGAHTIGQARCINFRAHIYNDTNIDPNFATNRRAICPGPGSGQGDNNLAPLNIQSFNRFDNGYFQDLVTSRGLLHSDQELFNGGSQDRLVRLYSSNRDVFATDFVNAMIKMGNISPLTGPNGEVRRNCRVVN